MGISRFYKNIGEARHWLPLLVDDANRGYGYAISHALMPLRDAVVDVLPTLRRIEQLAQIKHPAVVLDLGMAEQLIAEDEEFWTANE